METNTKLTAETLRQRYFDATATPAEEAQLRRLLSDTSVCGPEFDDVRAVMAFFAAARSQRRQQPWRRWVAAAAVVAAVFALTAPLAVRLAQPTDVCLAYVGGQKITAPDRVLALVRGQMEEAVQTSAECSPEAQLSAVFETLRESEK